MARFSLGREEEDGDEGSGPSSPRPISKRPKTTRCTASSPPPRHVPPPPSPPPEVNPTETDEEEDGEQIGEEEEEEEDSEYEAEEEEEEGEDLEEEEEEDGEDDEDAEAVFRLEEDGLRSRVEGCLNEVPTSDGSISVTLTDPDVLDCPICLEHLSIPVFQCENGHVACSSCCLKIRNRCPSCSWPIGYNRCRAIEKVLESVKVSCGNMKYGCKEMMRYSNKHEHENSCVFTPCSCPLLDCNFVGSSQHLYVHFGSRHLTSAERFVFNCLFAISLVKEQRFLILQERIESRIFILNHFTESLGSAVSVICIGQPSLRSEFSYDLIANDGDTCLKLQSFAESTPNWAGCTPVKKFLLVPNCYRSSSGQLKLEVCIRKHQQ